MSTSRVSVYRQYSRSGSASGGLSTSENLPPRTLGRLAREVRSLQKSPPEGVRLVVDEDSGLPTNLGELMIELQGPQGTPYETKFFLLKLVFSQDFPSAPPRGFFLTKLYHPNVDVSTGAICVNTLKKDWAPETSLSHVAAVIRCLLIVPFPESSLNDEAGKLFMESYEEYAKRARLMADVHGRSFSVVAKEGEGKEETTKMPASPVTLCSSKSSEEQQRGILQSASGNSGHAAPAAASAASVTAVKKVGNKKMMSRKKSLKRL